MKSRWVAFFLVLMLTAAAHAQISPGATRKEVIDVFGWPKSTSVSGNRELLSYPECNVLLEGGRVVKLEFRAPQSQMRLWNQFAQAKAAPPPVSVAPPVSTTVPPTPRPRVAPPPPRVATPLPPPQRSAPASTNPLAFLLEVGVASVVFGLLLLVVVLTWKTKGEAGEGADGRLKRKKAIRPGDDPTVEPRPPGAARKSDPQTEGWSFDLLKTIEWHRFEQLVAAYERECGHDARLTDFGPDHGIDIKIYDPVSGEISRLIQCKAHNTKVKVDLVRAFYGVMMHEHIGQGTYYALEGFTADAAEFARGKNLDLVNGATLVARIEAMDRARQARLLAIATEGDYRTPTCPSCGIKMRRIENANGRFWGCANYPRCRNKLRVG